VIAAEQEPVAVQERGGTRGVSGHGDRDQVVVESNGLAAIQQSLDRAEAPNIV
jgi:hypothetical protein